jgi:hypothetical protein
MPDDKNPDIFGEAARKMSDAVNSVSNKLYESCRIVKSHDSRTCSKCGKVLASNRNKITHEAACTGVPQDKYVKIKKSLVRAPGNH